MLAIEQGRCTRDGPDSGLAHIAFEIPTGTTTNPKLGFTRVADGHGADGQCTDVGAINVERNSVPVVRCGDMVPRIGRHGGLRFKLAQRAGSIIKIKAEFAIDNQQAITAAGNCARLKLGDDTHDAASDVGIWLDPSFEGDCLSYRIGFDAPPCIDVAIGTIKIDPFVFDCHGALSCVGAEPWSKE